MIRKLVCSALVAVLLGAFLAVIPVAAPAAHAAELPPVFSLKWGTNGSGNGQFNTPRGVAVDGTGNVYVADTYNHRIQKFTATGTYLTQWGTNGAGTGQFAYPRGVAVDGTGNVYVADRDNHRIQKFTATGTYLTQWGTNGTGNGQLNTPEGIAVHGTGNTYIADTYNHRIQKFVPAAPSLTIAKSADEGTVVAGATIHYHVTVTNTGNVPLTGVAVTDAKAPACAGTLTDIAVGSNRVVDCTYTTTLSDIGTYPNTATVDTNETDPPVTSNTVNVTVSAAAQSEPPPVFVRTWGTTGAGDGQFISPYGVAVDANGNVYVVDTNNNRIQKFTSTGAFLTKWGTNGTGNGQFQNPVAVTVDSVGDVYVADYGNHRVQKFTSTGAYLAQWGTQGTGNGQFRYPSGVAVDSSGNVYVADGLNYRVQKFTSTGTYVTKWGSYGTGNGQFNYPWSVAVDATGNVHVADINNFRIQKFTGTGTYLTQWGTNGTGNGQFKYPSGVAVDSSGNVYVAENTNNRVQQFAPSAIRGTVTESGTGTPLAGTWAVALRAADYRLIEGAVADSAGRYVLPVTPGAYRLEFVEPGFSHDIEWYDDHAWNQAGASNPVTATLGTTTTGIDAALNLPTGAISGTITQASGGAPLADAVVAVISTVGDEHPYSATTTATDGTYRLTGLPPGTYKTVAALAVGTHQPWFHGNTGNINTAATAAVTAGATTPGIDIALPAATGGPAPTATLTGTATDQVTGDNEPDVVVAALRAADFGFTVATFTNTNGGYTLTVPPGDYYLEFFDITHGHEFEWYHDQPHPTGNTLTTVTAPATADEDLIPLHGTAAGTLTDTATSAPLPGIWVAVMGATDGHGVAGTTTDSAGHYTLPGLDLGDYYLVFIDPTGRHDYEFHDNTPDIGAATPITITGSHTTTTDAALTPTT